MGTPIEEPIEETPVADDSSGVNPAWNDVLSILPEQFHDAVTGHFKNWDTSANQRIESVNSQLKEFEAYKPFLEHGINPDELQQSLRVFYEVQNNPENVFNALRDAYKFGMTEETSEEETEESSFDITQHPEYQKLQQNLQTVTEVVYNDVKAKQDAQEDMALEKELSQLEKDHGNFDTEYVLTKMMNGATGEQAVQAYKELVGRLAPQPFAPSVLSANSGGGTGLPSNAIDPTKLSGKETRNLVAQMIQQQMNRP